MLCRRIRVPYTVGLVFAGIITAFLPITPHIRLTKELIFSAFLPPLVFEAAFYIHWKELRRDIPVVLTLATAGVLLSAAVTAAGMYFLSHWELIGALLFGVLIAATDPVSVIATFKEAGVHGRLRLLVESESLFNDCTAAVAFSSVLTAAAGGGVSAAGIAIELFFRITGGLLCGAFIGGIVLLVSGQTEDHLVEITFTTIAAYGSFMLAEHFDFSGVLASLTAGLLIGNIGQLRAISDRGRKAVEDFWEYVAFVANSLIFILIGMHEAQQNFMAVLIPAIIGIPLVTLGRAMAVYACCVLFRGTSLRVKGHHQHILFWGGLRGALALALALGLPAGVPRREEIVAVSFAVVAFSVFVQGLSMRPLLRRAGEIP
jgi:CPA1 family monovalent cation:H+ antiporter